MPAPAAQPRGPHAAAAQPRGPQAAAARRASAGDAVNMGAVAKMKARTVATFSVSERGFICFSTISENLLFLLLPKGLALGSDGEAYAHSSTHSRNISYALWSAAPGIGVAIGTLPRPWEPYGVRYCNIHSKAGTLWHHVSLTEVRHATVRRHGYGEPLMGYDVGFAKRCFAARATLIDELAARDEGFRDLCHDFATADQLRQSWETSSRQESAERHAEFVELVGCLRSEIEAALDNAGVVPFPRPRR
jgi:hypothetical protein